jgi:hypothetical protein
MSNEIQATVGGDGVFGAKVRTLTWPLQLADREERVNLVEDVVESERTRVDQGANRRP